MKVYRPKEPSSRLPWNLSKVYVPRDPRYHLCNSCLKVHNIRKFAASCSLQQDMLVGDLTEDFNWSAPAVLYKFYADRCTTETSVSTSKKLTAIYLTIVCFSELTKINSS